MRKKGFTLIELLAVIVILSIIALIATPIIMNIINDAKENAFKRSIDGIVRSATLESALNIKGEDILYKYENNNWISNKLDIDGQIPKYLEIKVNKEGKVRYAITDGSYCATKEYDSKLTIKKIGNKNNDKEVQEKYCKLDMVIPTDISCFEYEISNKSASIKKYKCESNIKYVVIPDEIEGYLVTQIEQDAFRAAYIESVIIPDSVITIGERAFEYNNLKNVTIPDSVTTIGGFAFSGNNLTQVVIPSSVTSIGEAAFNGNKLSVKEAFIYNRNSDGSIDYSKIVSYGGEKKENIEIPADVDGVELKIIGDAAFAVNSIYSVTIPNTVIEIKEGAFSYNHIENIIFPNSVEIIGPRAFYQSNNLKSVTISDSVKRIEDEAFYITSELENVVLGSNLEYIGERAFSRTNLRSIVIPSSVEYIGESAFLTGQDNYNGKLTKVIIKGKDSIEDFTSYPSVSPFRWQSNCDDTKCIIWEGSN